MKTTTPTKPHRLSRRLRRLEDTVRLEPVTRPQGIAFADGNYRIRAAADRRTRQAAYRLVYDLYREKGYAQAKPSRLWVTLHEALPETVTLVVEREGEVVATATVVPDSPIRLPADRVYAPELAELRAAGRRPAEIISLAASGEVERDRLVLVKLFNFAYFVARTVHRATDLMATVNPRHAPFYRRAMLFEEAGPQRDYGKVGGAPAVLLRLPLEKAEAYRRAALAPECGRKVSRTLYRLFREVREAPHTAARLRRSLRPMTERELRYFFVELSDLLERASAAEREHLQNRYPTCDFNEVFLTAVVRC